jgi:hypothetical protein
MLTALVPGGSGHAPAPLPFAEASFGNCRVIRQDSSNDLATRCSRSTVVLILAILRFPLDGIAVGSSISRCAAMHLR